MSALVFSLLSALAPIQPPTQPPAQAPRVWIEDPVQLSALEQRGLDASRVAFDRAGGVDASRTRALKDAPGWRTIVDTLKADVRALYAKDKAYGVGMRFSHRAFDFTWLDATDVRFELAAVANRVDRRPFARDANDAPRATCGELRVLYRLAYATTTKAGPFSSRLPMTMNVVFWLPSEPDGGCANAARALEQDLPALVPTLARKSVEVNVQTLRWPSTVRPDLGGHAEYVLRVFEQTKDGLVPAPLENTPDIERIARSPALRAQALAWLRDAATAQGAVDGLALMPRTLAATRAVSATPRGLARAPNRPFTRLARALGAADVDAEVLRRLDAMSCMGCHQARSVAGFHALGAERDAARTVDALAIAHSPHVEDELPRRRAYAAALLAGNAPVDARPSAERADARAAAGTFGAACGLARFAAWTCAPGFSCVAVDDDEVGQCMPAAPAIGAACRPGRVDFARDRIAKTTTLACASDAVCEDVPVGFPGGMCAASCATSASDTTCGGIALLTPFNECLARGELFSVCAQHARPAALRACDDAHACRPDYVCAKTAEGKGACLPPYFVLQMRVDGHPRLK